MNKLMLFTSTLLLLACKKDKVEPTVMTINGQFLATVEETYNYTSENSDIDYNLVFSLDVENDSIVFDGYHFPLTSFDLYAGTGSHTISFPGNAHVTLTLSNIANTIQFEEVFPSYLSGPSWSKTLTGSRTTQLATTETTNTFTALSGNYDLYIQAFDNTNAIDTAYTSTLDVGFDPNPSSLIVDGVHRTMPLFHSYYNKTYNYGGSYNDAIIQNVYWENDSLYYHYRRTGGLSWPPSDTTHYHYQGNKQ